MAPALFIQSVHRLDVKGDPLLTALILKEVNRVKSSQVKSIQGLE